MLIFTLWIGLELIGFTFGVSRPPTLTEFPPKEATFVIREATKLPCVGDADPKPEYVWYKNGKVFNIASNTGRYTVWPGKGTLIIVNPHEDDDGLYQCSAKNQFGTAFSVKTNLRRAEFSSFSGFPQTKRVNRGESLRLACGKPTSYPPPIVSWRYESQTSIQNVVQDSRHSIDIYGNLIFANVQKEDDGLKYFCVATSELLKREERGYPYTIQVLNKDVDLETRVTLLEKSPTIRTGLLNDTIDFICIFGGNPTPTINWRYIDSDNQVIEATTLPHIRIDRSGVRLIIEKILPQHGGTYQCLGVNTQSVGETREFRLNIKSRPYWKIKPTNSMQPPGSSHTFQCVAHGDPRPNIEWTVNGQPADRWIGLASGRRRIEGERLVIDNLMKIDTAVVQCNASNNYGYVFADAYINVVQEPPSLIYPMEPKTYRAEGQRVVMNCSTYSAPAAIPKWTRVERNQQLTGGRYRIMADGNLEVKSLMVSDSGHYRCVATNVYGRVQTDGQLIVRRRTRITLAPKDVRVYELTEVKFVCSGITDPLEVKNLRQSWKKDGVLIDLTRTTRVRLNPADNSLIIGGVRPMDTGSYTCVISNGIDSASASAQLIVQGRPDQPKEVTVDCTTKKAAKIAIINWKAGADNSAPILKYEIEFAVRSQPFTWFAAELIAREVKPEDKKKDKEQGGANPSAEAKMRSGLTYRFRVRSRNIVGLSEPSDPGVVECVNPPASPVTNPTNLWLEGTQPDNIIVHWTPMSEFEMSGPNLDYKLTLSCTSCTNMPQDAVNVTYIDNYRDTNLAFIKAIRVGAKNYPVEKYKKYQATIKARNSIGDSTMEATKASGFSGEGPPELVVSDIATVPNSAVNVGQSNEMTLRWTIPDVNDTNKVNGFFRGYRVEWCHNHLSEIMCDQTKRYEDFIVNYPKHPLFMTYRRRRRSVDAEEEPSLLRTKRATAQQTAKLTRLPGASQLKVWVRILNKRYAGPRSNVITVTTATGTPGPVEDFELRVKGVTHLSFKWNKPSQTNGNLTGYQMGVQMISGLDLGYLKRYPEMNDPHQLVGEVAGLKPRSMYRIYIWPKTKAGFGVPNFLDVSTSPANVAPGNPTIRIEYVGKESINVTWAPSQKGEPGSVFYVQFRLPGRNKWEESQREFSRRWLLLSDLPTDTSYQLRVVATNGAGLTSFSETLWVTTGGPGPNQLAGASATWFIIMICLVLLLIGSIIGLIYLRRWRLNAIQGKPVPQEDPDEHRFQGGKEEYSQPTKAHSLEPADSPKTQGAVDPYPPAARWRPEDEGSVAASSASGHPAPAYENMVRRNTPPEEEEEWRPPRPGRPLRPSNGSVEAVDRAPGYQPSYDNRFGSPAPSSAGASINPAPPTII